MAYTSSLFSTLATASCIQRHSPDPPSPPSTSTTSLLILPLLPEKTYGKVSILNGNGSVVTTGTIVTHGERTQLFGRIHMNPALKIKSDEDGVKYDQVDWIAKYNSQIKRESVYASDPVSAKAYAENFQKAVAARNALALQKSAPRTPRPVVAPVQKTVFGMRQPPPSIVNLDLPPLPPMLCLPRLN
jgi:hypothetical protein